MIMVVYQMLVLLPPIDVYFLICGIKINIFNWKVTHIVFKVRPKTI